MEKVTPEQIGFIVLLTVIALVGRGVIARWSVVQPWVAALVDRWFVVRVPSSPEDLARGRRATEVLSDTAPDDDDIMSPSDNSPAVEPSVSQTDAPQTDQTVPVPVPFRSATLDTCKALRERGMSRDEARAFLKGLGWSLDNNTWAAAKPPTPTPVDDDDDIVTPFAGRRTKASYYPDEPEMEYQGPPAAHAG